MGALQRGWDLVSGKVARESKERFEEAQRIVDDAKERYEKTVERFEAASQQARVIADAYGEYRLECMTSDIRGYVSAYSRFANLEYSSDLPAVVDYNLPMNNTRFIEELSLSSRSAFEIKANILSAGAGAITAVGVFGCGMIGAAKAGAAVSTLSALAKGKAALSWLGRGSAAAGGFMLAGAVIIPFNVISGLINEAKSKEQLAKAESIRAQVDQQVQNLEAGIKFCKKLTRLVRDYQDFLNDFALLFRPMVQKLKEIEERERNGNHTTETGMIDFQSLPEEEKRALHLSWLMVQIYNKLLKTPFLTDKEEIAAEAREALESARTTQKQLLPGLIELADNGTVDIAFVKATKASRVAEKVFTITNWIITAVALLLGITSFTIDQVNDLLPGRNQVLFAGGMLIAGIVACPLLLQPKVKDFVIGEMDQKKKHAIQLVARLVIALAIIAATFYFFGRGW